MGHAKFPKIIYITKAFNNTWPTKPGIECPVAVYISEEPYMLHDRCELYDLIGIITRPDNTTTSDLYLIDIDLSVSHGVLIVSL